MKIAQIAPLYERVPPLAYGGTERVASYLTEELVRQGHEVTLFASGDSLTRAELVASCPEALRLSSRCTDPLIYHLLMLEQLAARAYEFDFIHFHVDYLHFPSSRRQNVPQITTLHGRLDLPDLVPLYQEFSEMPVVSISDSQRQPLPWLNWQGTVYHGLPEDLYTLQEKPGQYLAFVGRISPEKGVDDAIEIARRAGREIKIAAKVDRADREYFAQVIRPLLEQPHVDFVGEVGDSEKDKLLGGALAVLAPVNWPEPFGLIMIEALACGTPVIAYPRGSVPELITDGTTGFIVQDVDEAAAAVDKVSGLSRKLCRRVFEQRFSVARMARKYVSVYTSLSRENQRHCADRRSRSWKTSSESMASSIYSPPRPSPEIKIAS
ncbi:MAG TPA: glycosyltransferase family 4 protein [Terriglobia bacterium]|nr:glycosyltransferase family 4 protein [Terriglobia bacterium]